MARIRTDGEAPISVDEEAVRMVLAELREAGVQGRMKEELRRRMAQEEEFDPVRDEDPERDRKRLDKKLERCLGSLEADGARIDRIREAGRGVRFILRKGPRWDEHVTGEARLALKLASLSLSRSGTRCWHDELTLIEDIASAHVSRRDRELFQMLDEAMMVYGAVEDPVELDAQAVLVPLLEALSGGRMLELEYRAPWMSVARAMRVGPLGISHDLFSGGAFLLGWDPIQHKPKHYRLNRIESVKILRERFLRLPAYDRQVENARNYQVGSFVSGDEPFEIRVRILGRSWIRSLQEAPPPLPDFQIDPEKGRREAAIVRFRANCPEGPLRWVLQFGDCAEILDPPFLRQRIREILAGAGAAYGD